MDVFFKKSGIDKKGYQKNNPDIFNIAINKGSLKSAIQGAVRINKNYEDGRKPSQCDPCTTVHQLVLKLKSYITELL